MSTTYLRVKWSTSRARDTYGYNIVSILDETTGKRFRATGGGYDMTGSAFGEWLQTTFQDRLTAISNRAHMVWTDKGNGEPWKHVSSERGLYGMSFYTHDGRVVLDGACGLSSMERIAEAIGLSVKHTVNASGHTTGFIITDTRED
jgi:hypothetical protein